MADPAPPPPSPEPEVVGFAQVAHSVQANMADDTGTLQLIFRDASAHPFAVLFLDHLEAVTWLESVLATLKAHVVAPMPAEERRKML